jgi:hypothetical protein
MTSKEINKLWAETYVIGALAFERVHKFAALVAAAEREKVAKWMISKGYSTGHGDTTEDLLKELEWQIRERAELEKDAAWIYWFVDIRKASEQVLGVLEYLDKIDTERLYGLDEVIDGFYKTLNTRMPKREKE